MKALATNPSFIVVVLTVGGSVGFFNTVLTLLQQFTCSRGYSNEFSGLCGSLLLGMQCNVIKQTTLIHISSENYHQMSRASS
jgi:hypothetical protein